MEITQQAAQQEIQAIATEIVELLQKSMPGQEEEAAAPQHDEIAANAGADADQEAHQEGEEEVEDMASHLASMSDDELAELMGMLSQEMEAREAQGDDHMAESDDGQESMEMSRMAKSMSDMAQAIGTLTKTVSDLKAAPVKTTVVTKPVAMNTKDVQVLHKSEKPAERLSKSQTNDFIMAQARKSNAVLSGKEIQKYITDLNYIPEGSTELVQFQDMLKGKGLELPK